MPGIAGMTTSGVLRAAVIAEFNRSFDLRQKAENAAVKKAFLEVDSTRRSEVHAGFESMPKVSRWPRLTARQKDSFNEFYVEIENHDWNLWVSWNRNDKDDDQTKQLMPRVRNGAKRFVQLRERIMVQLLTSTSDPSLLPSIPNAYDGAALLSGSSRFGVATGNVRSGSGVATAAAIKADFQGAIGSYFHKVQDTGGEPYYDPSELEYDAFMLVFNPDNIEVFIDAFKADSIPATPLGSAAISNVLANGKFPMPTLYPTQRVTGDDWYMICIGLDVKPFCQQNRQAILQDEQTRDNSDVSRNTKEDGVGWDSRSGWGIWEPRTIVKVDN